jgi:FkbM family methyltransferase
MNEKWYNELQKALAIRPYHNYKSEGGQEKWVLKHLNNKKGGFFVDCGAAHPHITSNSWILEKEFDWKGVCIEPNKFLFDELVKQRSAKCLNLAVTNEKGKLPFRLETLGSSLDKVSNMFSPANFDIIEVECDLLQNILDEIKAPSIIDYMSLDIPGSEYDVVESFDYDKYKVRLLTVKHNPPNKNMVIDFLIKKGFTREPDLWIDMAFSHPKNLLL